MNPEKGSSSDKSESSSPGDLFVNTTAFLVEGENGLELVFDREETKCGRCRIRKPEGKCDMCRGDFCSGCLEEYPGATCSPSGKSTKTFIYCRSCVPLGSPRRGVVGKD